MLLVFLVAKDSLLGFPDEIKFLSPCPSGDLVAAVSRDEVLYIRSADGAVQTVADSVLPWGVSWSPDGSALAFVREGRVSIAKDGRITWSSQRFAHPGYPVWVGNELAFTGDGFLFIGDQRFAGFHLVATISPNPLSGAVSYTDIEGKFLLGFNPSTGKTDTLFSDPDGLALFAPQWSPDGKRIIVCRAGPGFWLWEPGSSEPRLVSPGEAPSWSPDGASVVYQVSVDDGHRILSSELYNLDLLTGSLTKLSGGQDRLMPRFGKRGVYYLTIDGKAGLFTAD